MSNDTEQGLLDALNDASTPQEPTESPAPSPEAPAAPDAQATPVEASPVQLDENAQVEFKVGGQTVRKPWREILQTQALLPADYTRKTQALSAERTSFQEERAKFEALQKQFDEQRQALSAALRDPRKIEALYAAALATQQQPQSPGQASAPPIDPAALQQHFLSQAQTLIEERFQALEQARVEAERSNVFERHVDKILGANPVLKALPNINDYLYQQVVQMVDPGKTTVEEALGMLDTVAQAVTANLNGHFTQVQKETDVRTAQLKNGIEPKGGSPVLPTPKQYDRKKGLDDPDLEADVLAYMKAQLGA